MIAQNFSFKQGDTGIPADYIKWIESAGGGVVPILYVYNCIWKQGR